MTPNIVHTFAVIKENENRRHLIPNRYKWRDRRRWSADKLGMLGSHCTISEVAGIVRIMALVIIRGAYTIVTISSRVCLIVATAT